jgi:hypothetical protein
MGPPINFWYDNSTRSLSIYEPRRLYYDTSFGVRSVEFPGLTECNGFDRLVLDVGILSLVLGAFAAILGLMAINLSYFTQIQTNVSAYLVGLPSTFLTLLGPAAPQSLITLWSYISMFDVLSVLHFFGPLGDFINMVDTLANGIGILSLFVSIFSTVPETSLRLINRYFGTNITKASFSTYKCPTSFNDGFRNGNLDAYYNNY